MDDVMDQRTCPHCNQPHPTSARFCPVTGMGIDQTPAVAICPKCHNQMQTEWGFCPYCASTQKGPRLWPLWIGILAVLLISGGYFLWTRFYDSQDRPSNEVIEISASDPQPTIVLVKTRDTSPTLTSIATPVPPTFTLTASALPAFTSTATFTATNTLTPIPTPTVVYTDIQIGEGIVTAYYLANAPDMDGNLQVWSLPAHPISAVTYGQENHAGSSDLSAFVMLGWNDEFLFLAAQVQDDRYVQNASGDKLYQGDHIEILLDRGGNKSAEKLTSDHYQLGLSLGTDMKSPEYHLWYPVSKRGKEAEIDLTGTRTSDGYILEAQIPWTIFDGKPKAGQPYGFSISVGDNDDPHNNMMKSMISSAPQRKLTIPSTWGKIYFEQSETRFYDFSACKEKCLEDSSNARNSFSEKTKKVHLRWNYENVPEGGRYVRKWSMNGKEWVRYECVWTGPATGVDEITLTEPNGLHSGTWEIEISINNQVLLQDRFIVEGKWTFWEPAGVFYSCYGKR
jgi:RNA polymerase subunit RPABC4/transcription elongation factor Spt4